MKTNQVSVIGAGKFGITIANILANKSEVLLYSRRPEVVEDINNFHTLYGIELSSNIRATSDLQEITQSKVIFPITGSKDLRSIFKQIGQYLKPYHIVIHGVKGFDNVDPYLIDNPHLLRIEHIKTPSQIITEESLVLKVGCISGPNLAHEILNHLPTATVLSSPYQEVIDIGKNLLEFERFMVYGSDDLRGSELGGTLKNIFAIGSGVIHGRNLGKNLQAMMISRGLGEMVIIGKAFNCSAKSFLGTSGLGDLIATATSTDSRNFQCGLRLAKGETINEILGSMTEVVEGVRTLKIVKALTHRLNLNTPVVDTLHKIIIESKNVDRALFEFYKSNEREDVPFDFNDSYSDGIEEIS